MVASVAPRPPDDQADEDQKLQLLNPVAGRTSGPAQNLKVTDRCAVLLTF